MSLLVRCSKRSSTASAVHVAPAGLRSHVAIIGFRRSPFLPQTPTFYVAHIDDDHVWPWGRILMVLDSTSVSHPRRPQDSLFGSLNHL